MQKPSLFYTGGGRQGIKTGAQNELEDKRDDIFPLTIKLKSKIKIIQWPRKRLIVRTIHIPLLDGSINKLRSCVY